MTKLAQYADDMNLLLGNDRSIMAAFDTMASFQQASGSKLNMSKTEGMYFGYQEGRTTGPVPIRWKTDELDILGTKMKRTMEQDCVKGLGSPVCDVK